MGTASLNTDKKYSIGEYLSFEAMATERHEYHDGKIVAMAGGTSDHSRIAGNVGTAINNYLLRQKMDCSVFTADLKVRIEKYNRCVYPDASLVCGTEEYLDENETVLLNPMLLIEVLSKSSKEEDRGLKFEFYRSIPSFKEYMIIYQTIPKVQTWFKEGENLWRIGNAEGIDQQIELHSIGCVLALEAIYRRVRNLKPVPQVLNNAHY